MKIFIAVAIITAALAESGTRPIKEMRVLEKLETYRTAER
jgi:hypothetical protein